MGRSLDVLDVRFLRPLDVSVGELLFQDWLRVALVSLAHAPPVPGSSARILKASHLFVCQVSDNFEDVATVAVIAEDVVLYQMVHVDPVAEESESEEAGKHKPSVVEVLEQDFIHYFY